MACHEFLMMRLCISPRVQEDGQSSSSCPSPCRTEAVSFHRTTQVRQRDDLSLRRNTAGENTAMHIRGSRVLTGAMT